VLMIYLVHWSVC